MASPKKLHAQEKKNDEQTRSNPTEESLCNVAAFARRFNELYNSSKFSDIILRVGDQRFYAHKFILITASDVFDAMFSQKAWTESSAPEIELTEESECVPVFSSFLKCLYGCAVDVSTDTVLPLLLLGDKYCTPDVQALCTGYMLRHIAVSPDTNRTLTWYQYTKATEQEELKHACQKFILSNFDVILGAPDWTEMSKMEVLEFISSSQLIVKNEFHLWQSLEKWLTFDGRKDEVEENLQAVLPLVRFSMISPKNLLSVESSPLYFAHPRLFSDLLSRAYRYHSLTFDCDETCATRELFRNYYSEQDYSLCFPFKLDNYQEVDKIDSRIAFDFIVPTFHTLSSNQPVNCRKGFIAYFYPQGFFTTLTLYGKYMNRNNEDTNFKMTWKYPEDKTAMKADITLVLYGKKNNLKYVAFTHNMSHTFSKEHHTLTVKNVIDVEDLKDPSPYLVGKKLEGKLFVKIQDIGMHLLVSDNQ